ncbi:hypothetical protein FQA39_LY07501 [Lamprigera yunnana]|nr:hypothetical protein FQA39_LY07501 [Lamprigera yunnana]
MELLELCALEQEVVESKSFQTKYKIVSVGVNCENFYDVSINVVDRKESEFQEKDSSWMLIRFVHAKISLLKFNPMQASFYVKLPPYKAIINVYSTDACCFGRTIASTLVIPNANPQSENFEDMNPDILIHTTFLN